MARNFLQYPFAPYQGVYSSKPFNSNRGVKGLMVGLDVLWATYTANGGLLGASNPNFVVVVNLNAAGPNSVSQLWDIQSVYIDNEGVDFPVYVYFPDTFFTVSCPPNSAGWYQVFTNARQALISGVGITTNSRLTRQRTRLFFTDVLMVPSLDQELQSTLDLWLGSPIIQRSGQILSGIGTPALGDQFYSNFINTSAGGQGSQPATPLRNVWGTPYPSGFLYITCLDISLAGFFNSVAPNEQAIFINSLSTPTSVVELLTLQPNAGNPISGTIFHVTGNIRLDATAEYIAYYNGPVPGAGGIVNINSSFSVNPN